MDIAPLSAAVERQSGDRFCCCHTGDFHVDLFNPRVRSRHRFGQIANGVGENDENESSKKYRRNRGSITRGMFRLDGHDNESYMEHAGSGQGKSDIAENRLMDAGLVGNWILRRERNGWACALASKLGRAPFYIQACERLFKKMCLRFRYWFCDNRDLYLAAGISWHLGLASNYSILNENL